jgi:hypothetical protein
LYFLCLGCGNNIHAVYQPTNQPSIKSSLIPEKLIVTHLIKKFPAFYGTRSSISIHKGPPPVPILSYMIHFSSPTSSQRIHKIPRPCVTFHNKLVYYDDELLAPSWSTTPCRLSATDYSIYSQFPSISRSRLLHPQPEDAPCRTDRNSLTWPAAYRPVLWRRTQRKWESYY